MHIRDTAVKPNYSNFIKLVLIESEIEEKTIYM